MGSETGNLQELPEKAIERAVIYRYGRLCYKAYRNYITLNNTSASRASDALGKSSPAIGTSGHRTQIQQTQSKLLYFIEE